MQLALVTGASRGLGAAIAMILAKTGVTVVGTATTDAGAARIGETLAAAGVTGIGLTLDVSSSQSVTALLAAIKERYNAAPSILVNNAGITADDLFLRMDEDKWGKVIETNLTGMYRLCKACIRPMLKARYGRIVNISSVVASTGNPGQTNYVAAKAGMLGFTKALAAEIAPRNITVNAVSPGFIKTDMTAKLESAQAAAILQQIPMGAMGDPEDIAYAVQFLVSDQAKYITGTTLHVNGGMFMN